MPNSLKNKFMKSILIKSIFVLAVSYFTVNVYGQINYSIMGNTAYENNQYLLAIEYFTKVLNRTDIDINERNDVTYKLAECFRIVNNPKRARGFYQRLLKTKFPEQKPEFLIYYGQTLNMLGIYNEAQTMFNKYLEKFPTDKLALAGKATSELGLNNKSVSNKWKIQNIREINSNYDDFAALYADSVSGSIMFTSNRKGTLGKERDNWTNGYFSDIFVASRIKGTSWGKIKSVDENQLINTAANEGVAVFNGNFTKMYFTRCEKMSENKMYCYILESEKTESGWGNPMVVYADNEGNVGHPTISSNGLELIFSSNRPAGFGGKDLWKITRTDEKNNFDNPVNLGSLINTQGDEMFPSIHNDTLLYFASNGLPGYGGLDIYFVNLNPVSPSNPVLLPRPVNSSDDDFAMNFMNHSEKGFFTSRRLGGRGGDDIYSFEKVISKISIKGEISDETTKSPIKDINALITNSLKDTISITTNEKGEFNVPNEKIKQNTSYYMIFSKDEYFSKTYFLNTGTPENDTVFNVNQSLLKIPEKPIVLPDIYYELDKWDLLPQYQDSLIILVNILKDNPKIVIELASHTDSRASLEYNDQLSQKRAETVVNFLTEKGIEKERLIAKGYGERKPRTLNNAIVRDGYSFPGGTVLTEDYIMSIKDVNKREVAHQLNRRTEFSVIRKNYK